MKSYSTRDAAKKLGIAMSTLSRHIHLKKIAAPKSVSSGGMTIHLWSESEIEQVRKLLPKIANGRKTRYKKKQAAPSSQQSAKTKAQARVPAPHKKRKPKKK
jgi:predicted DNA-binding transcriptional regulator AlpA